MLEYILVNKSDNPSAAIIWLHGLGADGHDFAPVAEMLDLAHIQFILPHAPYRSITMNNGYEMRAWYDLFSLNRNDRQDESGLRESEQRIIEIIRHLVDQGIPTERIAIAGFSQGGAIALHTALRYPLRLAGVLALSTYLPLGHLLAEEKSAANQHTPIFMAHGRYDEIITLDTCLHSRERLLEEEYTVEWYEYPMPHTVSMEEIDAIRLFLRRILPD